MKQAIGDVIVGLLQVMGEVEYGKIHVIDFPPAELCLSDGPSSGVFYMWCILGHGAADGGLVVCLAKFVLCKCHG